jgi:glycosyltransferase involved in cell wall biosynthesis
MKVAIYQELYPPALAEPFPPRVGGQGMRASGLARALVEREHRVSVYCVAHEEGMPARAEVDGVDVHRFASAPRYLNPRISGLPRDPAKLLGYSRWTRRHAAVNGADVHFYMQWPMLHAAMRPNAIGDRAIIDWCEVREGRLFAAIQRRLPSRAPTNTAVGESVARSISAASGRPVEFLPSGIEPAEIPPGTSPGEDLLFLGRLAEHKNPALAVSAFAELVARGYRGKLRIAGSGPCEETLREQIGELPSAAAARVELLGQVDARRKAELLASSGVLVLPSRREGFPLTVVEAMASGLPVVTVDLPENGTTTVLERYGNGVVTAAGGAELAAGIERALADRDSLAERGVVAAREFTWDATLDRFLELCESLPGVTRDTTRTALRAA